IMEGVTSSEPKQKGRSVRNKMFKKCIASIALIFTACSTLYALENVSFRIKALGSSLSGIVEDNYTDVLAYPARLSKWNKTTLMGKFGGSDTFTFGLFRKFGLIGEASTYRNLNESYSENLFLNSYSLLMERYTMLGKYDYDDEVVSLAGLTGVDLNSRVSLGSNYLYNQVKDSSNMEKTSTREYISSDQEILYTRSERGLTKKEEYSEEHQFAFGLLYLSESNKELDVTLTGVLKYDKVSEVDKDYDSTDNDPDGNAENYWGSPIVTPNKEINDSENNSLRRLKKKLGGGLQLRYSYPLAELLTLRIVVGGNYQPFDIRGSEDYASDRIDIEGSTTTVVSMQSSSSITGNREEINPVGAVGIEKKFGEQILLGVAIRWDGSFVTEDSTNIKVTDSSSQSTEKDKLHTYQHELSLPIGIELSPFRAMDLKFRLGARGKFSWQSIKETVKNKDTGAIIADLHSKHYDTDIDYTGGIGFVFKDLQLDVYTTTDFISFSQWQLQATIKL
ncbi:MAG: hypothetical protein ACETVT_04360, partial [bacterium]